jgi:hypothetical protein
MVIVLPDKVDRLSAAEKVDAREPGEIVGG